MAGTLAIQEKQRGRVLVSHLLKDVERVLQFLSSLLGMAHKIGHLSLLQPHTTQDPTLFNRNNRVEPDTCVVMKLCILI